MGESWHNLHHADPTSARHGVGRGQIQVLASLFHPDTPNDTAPRGYNEAEPEAGLPVSPLEPRLTATGFRWDEA